MSYPFNFTSLHRNIFRITEIAILNWIAPYNREMLIKIEAATVNNYVRSKFRYKLKGWKL